MEMAIIVFGKYISSDGAQFQYVLLMEYVV
jgi:hypothetical protein